MKYELEIAVKELDDKTLQNFRGVMSSVLGEQGLWDSMRPKENPSFEEGWSDEEGTPAIIVEWDYMENCVDDFIDSGISCYNDNWFVEENEKTIEKLEYINHNLVTYKRI